MTKNGFGNLLEKIRSKIQNITIKCRKITALTGLTHIRMNDNKKKIEIDNNSVVKKCSNLACNFNYILKLYLIHLLKSIKLLKIPARNRYNESGCSNSGVKSENSAICKRKK